MIALDTNILVYAHREEFPQHELAARTLRRVAEAPEAWGLPVFVLAEFVRVVTHPRYLDPPASLQEAIDVLDSVLASPSLHVLRPGTRYWELLRRTVLDDRASGNLAFDAQIVAVCREHGVTTVLTEDRGMRRFSGVRVSDLGAHDDEG
jgi:uncharacterized protein